VQLEVNGQRHELDIDPPTLPLWVLRDHLHLRGTSQDFVVPAVRIAKAVGRPVQLLWWREEDLQHDLYRPASMARLQAAVDAGGRLTGMKVRISAPSILSSLGWKTAAGYDPIALQGFSDTFYRPAPLADGLHAAFAACAPRPPPPRSRARSSTSSPRRCSARSRSATAMWSRATSMTTPC
jgi:hypothetical protein